MKKTVPLLFVCLFFSFRLAAQEPKGTGKTVTVKVDGGFNTKVDKVLPTGHWTFTNASEALCKEGDYQITGVSSVKSGVWTFYNSEGLPFVKITYKNDVATAFEVTDSGHNDCGSARILITADTAGLYTVTCFELKDVRKFTVKKVPAKISFSEISIALKSGSKTPSGPYGLVVYGYADEDNIPVYLHDTMIVKKFPEIQKSLIKMVGGKEKQNLVLNPGFDREYKYKKMKPDPAIGKTVYPFWGQALESPDPWRKGKESYAGFRVIGANYEILGGQLKKPLKEGKDYCFQMKIRLKADNHSAVKSAGVMLSAEPLKLKKFAREDYEENAPVVVSSDSMPLALRSAWQVISGRFTARGEEQYLYIGVFPEKMQPVITLIDSTPKNADFRTIGEVYYLVDDILIFETDSAKECPCNAKNCPVDSSENESGPVAVSTPTKKPKVYTFHNIQFETNSAVLLESSFTSLDSVLNLLDENPGMKLLITGHTDNEGDSATNMELSLDRAKAVYDYLLENRISASRLRYEGKGETQPVESNRTARGRARNRRVTFTVE